MQAGSDLGDFGSTSEAHQSVLLAEAGRLIDVGTPLALRLAGMCVVDYHQSILREAAEKMGLEHRSYGDVPQLLNLLRLRLLGLEKLSFVSLNKLRNNIYHNEYRYPTRDFLRRVLESAPKVRTYLLDAAAAAEEQESTMSRLVQRLYATALEMERELPTGGEEWRAPWRSKIDRAIDLAKSSPHALNDEGIDLLIELTRGVESSKTIDAIQGGFIDEFEPTEDEEDFGPGPPDEEGPYDEGPPAEFDPADYYPESGEDPGLPDPAEEEPADEPSPDERGAEEEPPNEDGDPR